MAWNNLPGWLKGGLIGGILTIIFSILISLVLIIADTDGILTCGIFFGTICSTSSFFMQYLLFGVVTAIPIFIIGALVGLIISKFKGENN